MVYEMMEDLQKKVSYMIGLSDGLKVDYTTEEGKLIQCMIEVIDEMAEAISELNETIDELCDQMDVIDENLGAVEDMIYGEDECGCGCGCEDDDDIEFFQIKCPSCGEEIEIDEDMLDDDDEIVCPNCNEKIEIEFGEEDE